MQDDAETPEPPLHIPHEEPKVRIMTLCDYAAAPPDGKLYLSGAGVVRVATMPPEGRLPILFLAIQVCIPWHMLSEEHVTSVLVRTLDNQPLPNTPDPFLQRPFELGRPPGLRPGDESYLNMVLCLANRPVGNAEAIVWHLRIDDREIDSITLALRRLPGMPVFRGA